MEADPKTNGAQLLRSRQRPAREIDVCFFGFKVHVTERDDALDGLLENLRAPTGLRPRIIPFPAFEPELFKRTHQVEEALAGRTKRMMIVICPTQPKHILAAFLNLTRSVASLPINTFLGKNDMTGDIATNQINHALQDRYARAEVV